MNRPGPWVTLGMLLALGACGGPETEIETETGADTGAGAGAEARSEAQPETVTPIQPETVTPIHPETDVLVSGPRWCTPVADDAAAGRARVFGDGEVDHPVGIIRLGLSPQALASLESDPREWVEGTFSWQGEGESWGPMPAGLRLKGGGAGDPEDGSFQPLGGKPAFKVDLNRFYPCGHFFGLTKLTLNNMVQDPTMVREWLAYGHFRQVGAPAARVAHAQVLLNDEPLGLYAHVETYDQEVWLGAEFVSTGHLYEEHLGSDLRPEDVGTMDIDRGDPEDRSDLEAVAAALGSPGEDLMGSTHELVNWEATLRFLVAEKLMGHRDGYGSAAHNVFFHLDEGGRLTPLPWGLDQALDNQGAGYHQGSGLLHLRCMQDPGCRQAFDMEVVSQLVMVGGLSPVSVARLEHIAPYVDGDKSAPATVEERQLALSRLEVFLLKITEEASDAVACSVDGTLDGDGDGTVCGEDCDDGSANTHPLAPELCDPHWQDEDCDGAFGEGCEIGPGEGG